MENRSALMKDMEEKIQNICIELSKYDVETIVISVDVKNKVSNSYGSKIACEFLNLKRNLTKQLLNFILDKKKRRANNTSLSINDLHSFLCTK
ncbi:hypothetical protein KUTeg_005564 [Tegillarca granosa]|uniref:Uncharacterized protein n=1 Tax=Tegillarca granosa TaxID=220873 RepID=A0ABQ9FK57_TEGGR|nr:hypothetical protein KUTeg_005564 [Tegillarca granosa]